MNNIGTKIYKFDFSLSEAPFGLGTEEGSAYISLTDDEVNEICSIYKKHNQTESGNSVQKPEYGYYILFRVNNSLSKKIDFEIREACVNILIFYAWKMQAFAVTENELRQRFNEDLLNKSFIPKNKTSDYKPEEYIQDSSAFEEWRNKEFDKCEADLRYFRKRYDIENQVRDSFIDYSGEIPEEMRK